MQEVIEERFDLRVIADGHHHGNILGAAQIVRRRQNAIERDPWRCEQRINQCDMDENRGVGSAHGLAVKFIRFRRPDRIPHACA
jgi:hypothetical protein